jgi:hypothetical protein
LPSWSEVLKFLILFSLISSGSILLWLLPEPLTDSIPINRVIKTLGFLQFVIASITSRFICFKKEQKDE